MALLTLHRTPSISTTPDEPIPRRGRLQKRESFALVKGAVLLVEEEERVGLHEETIPSLPGPRQGGRPSDTQRRHLHAMISLLRPEDTVKLAVRLESVSPVRVRYLLIVSTLNEKHESLLLGMDFPGSNSDECTIGLVLPVWSDTQVYLDGDGGFSVTSAEVTRIFKPVSIQTMWSVLQALHGCCERAVRGAVIPGCGLEWAQHYRENVESDQHCLNEWAAMTGLESVRKYTAGRSSSNRESVEREIKAQLRDIMTTEDLENITSKQVRTSLETRIGIDMKDYKEYIDNEMMVTMAQMDKPSRILDYLFLGSEWNAANFEELQKNNVGYILNVTMEIDNFFPESFTYMNIRVYDVEATDLLSHWNNTYMFISEARKSGQAILVHCKMGVSRSASTVIAYLMKQQGWTLDHALNHVRERRPIVQPNEGFLKQLHTYSGILSASKQRHSALWRRKSKPEVRQPSVHNESATGSEQEQKEEEEDSESPGEGSSNEDEETDVFDERLDESFPDTSGADIATSNPLITVQESDKVSSSPSRSGRMDLFSLMQSIQLDDEDRGMDKEISQRLSPAQRRRSHGRRGLTHQRAHVDVSPEPSSRQSQNPNQDGAGL
ncbi:protein phosphatase Slingshot homolog 3 [Labeo rohita]|uniref:protein phosphatase Slingshot homolog 3 n=1 Tax=Labeo rohita TaxID=84645 RepID=UPI0021E2B614|nr:protein phosphatase Slingshot homolog 3 [Labeo rohita]XP_050983621.1 protein phosphatase Slingshot homolog 3 [Labeo rohita]